MALINCSECGREMSDTVKNCPHCGYKLKKPMSKTKKVVIFIVVFVISIGCGMGGNFAYTHVIVPATEYSTAEKNLNDGNYVEAINQFERLGDYKDSGDRIKEAYYMIGKSSTEKNDYDSAIDAFKMADNYKDAKNQIEELNKKIEEREKEKALQAKKDKMKSAYDACSDSGTSLAVDGMTITISSDGEYDYDSLLDLMTVISELGISESLMDEMGSTTALMGRQTAIYGDYEVSWSYHPDNGLDAIFKLIVE